MKLFSLSSKKKTNFFLGLDIGTEAIKALIFSKSTDGAGKVSVLGTFLKYFEKENIFQYKNFEIEPMKNIISSAIEGARKNLWLSLADKKTKEEFREQKRIPLKVCLPANIFKSRIVRQFFLRPDDKKKIFKIEEEDIREKIFENAKKEISEIFCQDSGILPKDIHWLSFKILGIKIDGYKVLCLQGYEGKEIEFKILVSFLPEDYFTKIKKIFAALKMNDFEITQEAQNLINFLNIENREGGIFLDVGGEITQIFFVGEGCLEKIEEFAIGGRIFSQIISQKFGIDEESARLLKESYSNNLLSSDVIQKIKEVFGPTKESWYENFERIIEKTDCPNVFSCNVYLLGGGSVMPEIKGVLREKPAYNLKSSSAFSPKNIETLSLDDFRGVKDETRILNKLQNIPSLLICYS